MIECKGVRFKYDDEAPEALKEWSPAAVEQL